MEEAVMQQHCDAESWETWAQGAVWPRLCVCPLLEEYKASVLESNSFDISLCFLCS